MALRSDGSIKSWGYDSKSQVSNTPTGTGFVQVSAGDRHSVALRSDGSIISWGDDTYGQITKTPRGTGFIHVAGGGYFSLALKSDGSIFSWGPPIWSVNSLTPIGTGFVLLTAGYEHALALTGPPAPFAAYCTAGTSANACTPSLSATGAASASASSGFDVIATNVEGLKDGLYFFGTNGRQSNPWGNGTSVQCVIPPVKRAGLLIGTGTLGLCDGYFQQDLNARWTAQPAQNPGAGAVVQAQLWYRDPFNTSNQTTSLSDAIEFTLAP